MQWWCQQPVPTRGHVHWCCTGAAPGAHTCVWFRPKLSVQTSGSVTKKGPSCVSEGSFGCTNLSRRGRKYPARPCELDVGVTQEGFGWGLWPPSEQRHQPLGLWSRLWKGAEVQYSLPERQLAAAYAALLATEVATGTAPVTGPVSYCRVGLGLDGQAS